MASTRRKSAAIALAVIGVAGLSLAAAAQLNVNSGSLGAASKIVASCQPVDDGVTPAEPVITIGYVNAYDEAVEAYLTTDVTLDGVASACAGQTIGVTVADEDGVELSSGTLTAATGLNTIALTTAVDAAAIERVAVVIAD